MPEFNRRRFLQVASAAGLAPALPVLPAAAASVSGGATSAKMLWASLYARAGSGQGFAGVASGMGLSSQAATGVAAKILPAHVLAAQGGIGAGRAAVTRAGATGAGARTAVTKRSFRADLERMLSDLIDDEAPDVTDTPEDSIEDETLPN